jgi:hypothetical protein
VTEKQGQTPFSTPTPKWTEADFSHPVFDPVRPWLRKLPGERWPSRDDLNALARGLTTLSGHPLRFVPPASADPYYEVHVSQTGRVQTREENWHDLFNALAWLAFPRTKARINAMHAEEIAREAGVRGRKRDMLTLLDEGGAIVTSADSGLENLIREHRWKELFWEHRAGTLASLRIDVIGHAVLEMALRPWPGITCKVIFVEAAGSPDAKAEQWLVAKAAGGTTRDLASLPIFGFPGWLAGSEVASFYDDERYFRRFRKASKNVVRP